jgi:hypothetical protein
VKALQRNPKTKNNVLFFVMFCLYWIFRNWLVYIIFFINFIFWLLGSSWIFYSKN